MLKPIRDKYVIPIKERQFVSLPFRLTLTEYNLSEITLNKEKIDYLLTNFYAIKTLLEEKSDRTLLYQRLFNYGFDIYSLFEEEHNLNSIMDEYKLFLSRKAKEQNIEIKFDKNICKFSTGFVF